MQSTERRADIFGMISIDYLDKSKFKQIFFTIISSSLQFQKTNKFVAWDIASNCLYRLNASNIVGGKKK